MKSTHVRSADAQERWILYDASEHTLGRMASQIAMHLMGKDRPTYTPDQLTGAHVVVINAAQAKFTGKKGETKEYQHYTKYAGGLKRDDIVVVQLVNSVEQFAVYLACLRLGLIVSPVPVQYRKYRP